MAEATLIARVRPDAAEPGVLIVSSPAVGVAESLVRPGMFLHGQDPILSLLLLGRRHVLRLPRDAQGWVRSSSLPSGSAAVEYGTPLLVLEPKLEPSASPAESAVSDGRALDAGDAGNRIVVRAATDGVFYSRSAPDLPPYVEVGATVSPRTVLGLIEVMKCFHQITAGDAGLSGPGEVVRVGAADAAEVKFGDELFWIRRHE